MSAQGGEFACESVDLVGELDEFSGGVGEQEEGKGTYDCFLLFFELEV